MTELERRKSVEEKAEAFLKVMRYRRLFSLLSGVLSGFFLGMVVMLVIIGVNLSPPYFPLHVVIFMMVAAVFSIGLLVWEINSAFKSDHV